MLNVKFRYRDEMSNWTWRTQECVCRSIKECIDIYGLGIDCDYEILSCEGVSSDDLQVNDRQRIIEWQLPDKDLPGKYETVLLSIIDTNGNDLVTIGGYDYFNDNFMMYDNGNLTKVVDYPERVTAWAKLPTYYNDFND